MNFFSSTSNLQKPDTISESESKSQKTRVYKRLVLELVVDVVVPTICKVIEINILLIFSLKALRQLV